MKAELSLTAQRKLKAGAARLSILSAVLLTALKFTVGFFTNSIGVISEGVNSLLDVFSASVAYLAIKKSVEPADKTHPYGHGKFEDLAGVIQAIIIFFTGLFIVYEAIRRFLTGAEIHALDLGLGVMLISMLVSFLVARRLSAVARRTDSVILKADSIHFGMDLYTGLGVFIALLLVRYTGKYFFDPLAAIIICGIILTNTYEIFKRVFEDLTDRGLPDAILEAITEIMRDHYPELVGFHDLRTRRAGAEKHIDMHLEVCKETSFAEVNRLIGHLEEDIGIAVPGASVIIRAELCQRDCDKCIRFQILKRKT